MSTSKLSTDPPSIKDELTRKTLDTLTYLALKHERGEIDAKEFSLNLDVLFMTVSGLVAEDFIDVITAVGDKLQEELEELDLVEEEAETTLKDLFEEPTAKKTYYGDSW